MTEIKPPPIQTDCPPHRFMVGTIRESEGDALYFVDRPFLYCERCGTTKKVEL